MNGLMFNSFLELSISQAQLLEDFEKAKKIKNIDRDIIAIFGGGAVSPESQYYDNAVSLAYKLAESGFSVMTGGGPGIMEAGNKGCKSSKKDGSLSIGLRVKALLAENATSPVHIDEDFLFEFNTLSIRLLTLISASKAIVFFPGGYGTLEELFSLVVRIKTGILPKVPVYLFDKIYWSGLLEWIKESPLSHGLIHSNDINIIKVKNSIDEISESIILDLKQS